MESSSRKPDRGLLLISNLPALQNLIKRDPAGYASEFAIQWDHYQSLRSVIQLGLGVIGGGDLAGARCTTETSGGANSRGRRETEDRFREIVGFLAQTSPCYINQKNPIRPIKNLASELSNLLLEKHDMLHPETRKSLVQALVGMRRKDTSNCLITNLQLLRLLFALLPMSTSPTLRASILKTILTDIKLANKKTKNHQLNRAIQGMLFNLVENGIQSGHGESGSAIEGTGMKRKTQKSQKATIQNSAREAMWAVKLASELWRKSIWDDSKTIQILVNACFHSNTKVQSAAIHFFLADSDPALLSLDDLNSDAEPEDINIRQVKHVQTINKKRKSTERKTEKKIKAAARLQRAKQAGVTQPKPNFAALQLIQDPQNFGERLYDTLLRNDKFYTLEHKIIILRLFSRISSIHKLQVLPFYSYILKYIAHHQLEVTTILAALAESVHELTPPDVLSPCLRKLANEFVHPGVALTVIAAGLNAITEISRRQPLAMESDLLLDLIEYRKSKDKAVIAASRGLLSLFREINPTLLRNRDRGKKAAMEEQKARRQGVASVDLITGSNNKVTRYGEVRGEVSTIAGLTLLEQAMSQTSHPQEASQAASEDDLEGWEVDSNDDSSSSDDSGGGWIDVSSDEAGALELSDSSDEENNGQQEKETRRSRMEKKRKINTGGWKAGEITRDSVKCEIEENRIAIDQVQPILDPNPPLSLSLAETKILTPADFAKLNELKIKAIEEAAKKTGSKNSNSTSQKLLKKLQQQAQYEPQTITAIDPTDSCVPRFVSTADIIGKQAKAKQDYEERMASIQAGREGRQKFGSAKVRGRQGLKDGVTGSTTNEAKARRKAFAMTQHSNRVRGKKSASLYDRQKTLRAHIDRKKRGGRRGNG
ncbi:hypothetical protein O181_017869 [Austropuccinia psidii MF-1]|uniref:Protein SDA1 n=1 Tax=Austropuccinia psidii MF-1 TaxID=1389203 RepID=A0A9Q3C467_9BASI|nr:hypothetical protein [Austropuccinia psidii MF-1]